MPTGLPFGEHSPFANGQLFECPNCGAEIEIIIPSPRRTPEQVFQCCGRDMIPTVAAADRDYHA